MLSVPVGEGECRKKLESGSEVIPSNSKLTILEGNFQVSMRCISGISALDVPIVPSGLVYNGCDWDERGHSGQSIVPRTIYICP